MPKKQEIEKPPTNKCYIDLGDSRCMQCKRKYCVCKERQDGTWEDMLPIFCPPKKQESWEKKFDRIYKNCLGDPKIMVEFNERFKIKNSEGLSKRIKNRGKTLKSFITRQIKIAREEEREKLETERTEEITDGGPVNVALAERKYLTEKSILKEIRKLKVEYCFTKCLDCGYLKSIKSWQNKLKEK